MIEGFERVDPEIAAGHMTENGEPMTADDRCLRLEEYAAKADEKIKTLETNLKFLAYCWGISVFMLFILWGISMGGSIVS